MPGESPAPRSPPCSAPVAQQQRCCSATPVTAPRPQLPNWAAPELGRLPASPSPPPMWLCHRGDEGVSPPANSSIPFGSPRCPHVCPHATGWPRHLSIVALDGSETWLRPSKLMSHVAPGPFAVPWVAEAKPGLCWSCGDPPSPTPEPEPHRVSPGVVAGPGPRQREPPAIAHPDGRRPPPRVPVTTKENISGWKLREGRHGNTAAGFHQKPAVPPQKDIQVPPCSPPGRHRRKTRRGRANGTQGWSHPNHRCPRPVPAGAGDMGRSRVTAGAASWQQSHRALGAMPRGRAGCWAGGAEGTPSQARMGTQGTTPCGRRSRLSHLDGGTATAGLRWGGTP